MTSFHDQRVAGLTRRGCLLVSHHHQPLLPEFGVKVRIRRLLQRLDHESFSLCHVYNDGELFDHLGNLGKHALHLHDSPLPPSPPSWLCPVSLFWKYLPSSSVAALAWYYYEKTGLGG